MTGIELILLFFILDIGAQISPGDLSQPHAHLKGLSNCTKCHTLGEKISNQKCLDCHLDIGIRLSEGRGYHSSIEVQGKACIKCHSDHHGQNFKMIRLDKEHFDHTLTGYNLQGGHQILAATNATSLNSSPIRILKQKLLPTWGSIRNAVHVTRILTRERFRPIVLPVTISVHLSPQ